ncbi:probable E3 ubiquitin-protein ligase WAVH2 isoform X1 [Cannabis sativa]|uniref:probable E3 ubiquitin-protein ligase WAVH2 isoform X1 n=1 Tax=Cannabis sativa TaxID=3483 RepID=UPI0029C9B429|nr:probable E3 ubiquitin-protein ligase WAVH2 isoform X1 [Cannabis sativa]
MGGGRGASSRLRKAARNIAVAAASACGSFSRRKALVDPIAFDNTNSESISGSSVVSPSKSKNISIEEDEYITEEFVSSNINPNLPPAKNLCAICLDPLNYNSKGSNSPSQAIFTAQCSHAFHFACISSNVRHGSVTCPICRAHWTQLPRNLNAPCASINHTDPILRILDDSIATFRIHRRSFIRSARYDDDDPIEPEEMSNCPRLQLSLVPIPTTSPTNYQPPLAMPLSRHLQSSTCSSSSSFLQTNRAYLSVKLANQRATDLVLVASPNGPHLRLLKQCMALLVFSLRPTDRLAIVTYSSAAARVFPLRRMTSCGRRAALQVIDRLFYMGQADPVEGLKKGIKILQDRAHKNPESGILHLSDSPTQSYHASMMNMEVPIPVHRFHVGFGYGTSSGYIMHGFEEFLAGLLGGVIREIQLRVRTGNESANGMVVRIGELRGDEERRVLLDLGESGHACVEYSYSEDVGEVDERFITGETLVSVGDSKSDAEESGLAEEAEEVAGGGSGGGGRKDAIGGGRPSSVESWDYHDPYMARRWAKHLHGGYRF